jgi:D-aminoacyl-tRNA deacylase
MRALLQRVSRARVIISDVTAGEIQKGLVLFLGIARNDTVAEADYLLNKTLGLRIFDDADGKMNLNVEQAGGGLLIVSQFTLYADCRKGRRPGFELAAPPEQARHLYDYFVELARSAAVPIATGIFQAAMRVELSNEGPVTILLDSADRSR